MRRAYGRLLSCAERFTVRDGCHCVYCRQKRRDHRAKECARLKQYNAEALASAKRPPERFRCCGWLQQIPEGETARCGRCGTVPLFARPEPDLRQFRNGR